MPVIAPPTPLQISYIDPDGGVWNLSDLTMPNGYVCSAISGIEGFPVSMQTIPMLDGTAVPSFYLPQPGNITLAVLLGWPASGLEADYYTLIDTFVRAFYHRRQELPKPGTLIVQRPDGTSRQITVYTTSGLETPDVGVHNCLYTLTLNTPDPYWQDSAPTSLSFKTSVAPGILPLLPIQLDAPTTFGNYTVTTKGNAIAWPTWTITGPGTPTVQNLTTGRKWSLNTAIPGGNVIQVTTKPGSQMAVNQTSGTSVWSQLVLSSLRDLWPLMAGSNQISVVMTGSTPASNVLLTWNNRWNRA